MKIEMWKLFFHISIFARTIFTERIRDVFIRSEFKSSAVNWSISFLDSGASTIRSRIVSRSHEIIASFSGKSFGIRRENIVTIGHHSIQS